MGVDDSAAIHLEAVTNQLRRPSATIDRDVDRDLPWLGYPDSSGLRHNFAVFEAELFGRHMQRGRDSQARS